MNKRQVKKAVKRGYVVQRIGMKNSAAVLSVKLALNEAQAESLIEYNGVKAWSLALVRVARPMQESGWPFFGEPQSLCVINGVS